MAKDTKYGALSDEELGGALATLLEENARLSRERAEAEESFKAQQRVVGAKLDQIDSVLRARRTVEGMTEEQKVELRAALGGRV